MPLVRFEVRNEFRLGQAELYRDANREDPKAVLDGVAVTGLVGILRQLGDLAEFAAEVFHGLQEQVMTTASRSHKLMAQVQQIEASLPTLEKAILAQTSHIHFAYTVGSEWHPHIPHEQNHFIYNDLPRFIMDSYEECQDPPRLHLLDKFDTGGPGSCLKRYSDPTFFRRVSEKSDQANAEKVHRDKKARKSRKKRSFQRRNEEVSRGESLQNHSGRMQFTSPAVKGRSSSQTSSTVDMTFKSELGDHSNSFDSRTGSGYIECVFHPSSSMRPEEMESRESSFRLTQHYGASDSTFSGDQSGAVDNDFQHPSSQEQIKPRSSCVTWDEKAEIVEPMVQEYDSDEAPEILPIISDLDMPNGTSANLTNVDQTEILFDDENTPTSTSSKNELDEIESEPDNFMDALNTIESESDNDFECQTKREVEQYSLNCESVVDGKDNLAARSSDHDPSNDEYHRESFIFSNREMTLDFPNSVSSEETCNNEQTTQIPGISSNSECSLAVDYCGSADIPDNSKVESVSDLSPSGSKSTDLRDASDVKIQVQESPAELSGVRFWTNGGLLGLEPSKPPDFSVSNALSKDSENRSKETDGPSKGDIHTGKLDIEVKNAIEKDPATKFSTSCQDDKGGDRFIRKTSWIFSTSEINAKPEESTDSHSNNKLSQAQEGGPNMINVNAAGTELPVVADIKPAWPESNHENDENSSRVFGRRHKLLVNGFREKLSLVVADDKPEPASPMKTGILENSGHHGVTYQTTNKKTFKDQFEHGSLLDSLTSSPPLEHMKISFHPIIGSETSKLKLKFPDGSHCHQSSSDMFPSFQLVPEPIVALPDIGYDSDDDTFCRSSPYMSDDCLSNYSESNSEQWESGDTPGSKDQELYDAMCRMSSMESISSSTEISGTATNGTHVRSGNADICTENGVKPSITGPILDFQSSYSMNPDQRETESNYHPKNNLELQNPGQPTPPPPPLPPAQWRISKTHLVLVDDQDVANEGSRLVLDSELSGSALSQQPMLASVNRQEPSEQFIAHIPESKKQEEHELNGPEEVNVTANDKEKGDFLHQLKTGQQELQKLNGQKEANLTANEKEMDEREEFLHQIKTKSFNLKRTVTARPAFTPNPATNVNVNAILEKANAIRQAVGSDDGEDDDNWSDA